MVDLVTAAALASPVLVESLEVFQAVVLVASSVEVLAATEAEVLVASFPASAELLEVFQALAELPEVFLVVVLAAKEVLVVSSVVVLALAATEAELLVASFLA